MEGKAVQNSQFIIALSTFVIGSLVFRFGIRDGMSATVGDNIGWLIFSVLTFAVGYFMFPRIVKLLRPATR